MPNLEQNRPNSAGTAFGTATTVLGEFKPLCQHCHLREGELVGGVLLCEICRFQRFWREDCCE